MTSAPWWFVAVTALVAGAFTLAASWLAGMLSLKRLREELAHSRALERAKEAHATTLERQKELYNRRVDFYLELVPLIDQIMEALPPIEAAPRRADRDEPLLDPEQAATVGAFVETGQQMYRRAHVISSKAVRALLSQFLWELRRVIDNDQYANLREVAWAANHLIWELRMETGVTTRGDDEEFELRGVYCMEY